MDAVLVDLVASVPPPHYPGGTIFSANSVEYDWSRDFVSSLFRPTSINGVPSATRYYAIPALAALSAVFSCCLALSGINSPTRTARDFTSISCAQDILPTSNLAAVRWFGARHRNAGRLANSFMDARTIRGAGLNCPQYAKSG
jgi:hypothetical protein